MPGRSGGFGDILLEVVHIVEGGHAAADQFRAGNGCAEPHEVGRNVLALDGHHVAHQPDIEAQVVGQAAQERHGNMGVGVDQARQKNLAAAIERLAALVFLPDLRFGPNGDDAVACDGNGAAGY